MSNLKSLRDMLRLNVDSLFSDNDSESISAMIEDMKNQAQRLEIVLSGAKQKENIADKELSDAKKLLSQIENRLDSAMKSNNSELTQHIIQSKRDKEQIVSEKQLILTSLNAQASELKEQLDALNEKLSDVSATYDRRRQEYVRKDSAEIKPAPEVAMDRMMKQIRDSQNNK